MAREAVDRPADLDTIPDGTPLGEIAARYEVSVRQVRAWLGEGGRAAGVNGSALRTGRWDAAWLRKVYEEEGWTLDQIGREMGVSHQRVSQVLADNGIGRPTMA